MFLFCAAYGGSWGSNHEEDKDFVEYDATGKPTIAMCFDCADLGGRLRPDLAALGVQGAKTMLARYRAGTGCLEDTSFKKDFMAAARFQQKSGDQLRAPFMPGSAVMNVTSYGIRVSHVYALLTEAEYAALLGAPPSAIKLAPTSLPVLGPGQSRNYYVLDMEGLPEAVKSTCKKLEIFYNAESEFDQIYLDETTQVHQDQGEHVFAYIAKSAFQSRPEKSRPASVPLTLEEARLKHQEAAAAQAAAGDTSTAVAADQDGEEADDAVPREVRSFGIVAATTAAKPGTKGKRKTQPGAALPAVPTEASRTPRRVSGTTPEAVEAVADEEKPMSESSVAGGKAGQLARLDKDMKLVAEKHWLNHANASVKSLEALSPVKYLLDCTKPLSLSLNGVRVSAYVVCDACVCVYFPRLVCEGGIQAGFSFEQSFFTPAAQPLAAASCYLLARQLVGVSSHYEDSECRAVKEHDTSNRRKKILSWSMGLALWSERFCLHIRAASGFPLLCYNRKQCVVSGKLQTFDCFTEHQEV